MAGLLFRDTACLSFYRMRRPRTRNIRRVSFSLTVLSLHFFFPFFFLSATYWRINSTAARNSHGISLAINYWPEDEALAPTDLRARARKRVLSHRTLARAHTCAMTNNRVSAISIPHAGSRIWPNNALWIARRVDYTRLRSEWSRNTAYWMYKNKHQPLCFFFDFYNILYFVSNLCNFSFFL